MQIVDKTSDAPVPYNPAVGDVFKIEGHTGIFLRAQFPTSPGTVYYLDLRSSLFYSSGYSPGSTSPLPTGKRIKVNATLTLE